MLYTLVFGVNGVLNIYKIYLESMKVLDLYRLMVSPLYRPIYSITVIKYALLSLLLFIHEGLSTLSTPVSGVMGFTACVDCDPQQVTLLITHAAL